MGHIKRCTRCGEIKDYSSFSPDKRHSDGCQSICLDCYKQDRKNNPEKYKKINNKTYLKRKNEGKVKKYLDENKDKIKLQKKIYIAVWRQKNKEHIEEYNRQNEERDRENRRVKAKIKLSVNIQYKLKLNLSRRIRAGIQLGGVKKNSKTMDLLGCSINFLMDYLESKFLIGMSWDNYGNRKNQWSIDHIIPCTFFDLTKEEAQLECFHYTNLQPLWWIDNIRKSNKLLENVT
jgi:hypothetical protein